ncbi:SOS-response repressor and protease LexA [Lachnospiraceae bacterium TWA4]|nr:SOS-response repressor and protease LexA [Lachnospiraceae bacterium TWA4]
MVRIDRINELLKQRKWSRRKLEIESNLGLGTISRWNKFNPTTSSIKKVADVLGVSTAYLTGDSDYMSEQDAVIAKWTEEQKEGLSDEVRRIEAGIRIPVLGEVPCGIPNTAIELVDENSEWEEISEKLARTGNFFGLQVKGDSMSPRIQEGDVLIVKQQEDAENGDIVIAKVNGDDACCKRLLKYKDGITLQSLNPIYDPMYFSNADILNKPVKIIGKVVENRQKF